METCPIHPENDCNQANAAAEIAVRKVFAILGVNVDVPKDVQEFQENLRFGATLKRAADRGMIALIIAIAGGLAAALWTGIVMKVTGGH